MGNGNVKFSKIGTNFFFSLNIRELVLDGNLDTFEMFLITLNNNSF